MKRLKCTPRLDWQKKVEELGFTFHTADDGQLYWNEGAYYEFTTAEISELERASYALNAMCLEAVEHVITKNLWAEFHIPPEFGPWIAWSWAAEERTIIGRFDLAYDGIGAPRMLEYNADTPTSLLEASVVQWAWVQEMFAGDPTVDQFNSIHEKLIDAWRDLKKDAGPADRLTFFTMAEAEEDRVTTAYLHDTAMQAGWETEQQDLSALEFDFVHKAFVAPDGAPVLMAFKLYPWEWMLREEFGKYLTYNSTRWLEAPWKMILNNKALLPLLHRLYPDSPYLLKAGYEPQGETYVRKPIFGREGAGVELYHLNNRVDEQPSLFDDGPAIYQEYVKLPQMDGNHVVIGSWMVNGYSCGIGVRESDDRIISNLARFVPHVIKN